MAETIELTDSERGDFARVAAGVPCSPYGPGFDGFKRYVDGSRAALSLRLLGIFTSLRGRSGHGGALLVRGVPVPFGIGPTPREAFPYRSSEGIGTESALLLVARRLGEPIGFASWHDGERIQNFYPIASMRGQQCASNSTYLELHTENAFRPTTPHFVCLLCVRDDARCSVPTLLCDLRAVVTGLDKDVQEELMRPKFAFRISGSQGEGSGTTEAKPVHMAVDDMGVERFDYAEALISVDESSEAALAALNRGIAERLEEVILRRGDLMLLDNRHVIHGRRELASRFDGTDRWLQRILVRTPRERSFSGEEG